MPSFSTVAGSRNARGLFLHFLPETAENPARLLELRRRDVVLVDALEQEAAQTHGRIEDRIAHADLGHAAIDRLVDDIGDHAADTLGR